MWLKYIQLLNIVEVLWLLVSLFLAEFVVIVGVAPTAASAPEEFALGRDATEDSRCGMEIV